MAINVQAKAGAPRYETFVDTQLAKVRGRIRAQDAGRSLLLLGVTTLAYFLLMAGLDLAFKAAGDSFFTTVRLCIFGVYTFLALYLLSQLALRFYRRINPRYAAKQLENTIPDAKNSVINWLDLKEQELPGAIRMSVGQRAALELKNADPEKAVNPKGNWVLTGVLAALTIALLILFASGPNQFGSLWKRAFAPFLGTGIGSRTEITLLRPAAGNIAVPLNQRIDFQASIEGRYPKVGQPGAPRLLYRYQAADSYVALPLDEGLDGTFGGTILGDQVLNGFWYKIAAGDAETPEYRVKVQALPQATRFELTYHYRAYRKLHDDLVIYPNEQALIPRIREYRGTDVELVIRTNRDLRAAQIEMESSGMKQELQGVTISPDDPRAVRARLTLEERGSFRLFFTAKDGEENVDRSPYPIEVLDDLPPRVVLTKPGQDVSLPLGGTLQLEGLAQDDIGLRSMALRLQVLQGEIQPALQPKLYRQGKSFQFDDGTYPNELAYKDFVILDKVKTSAGDSLPLKAGMVLQYWLEATDNCDYPSKDGNVGKSETYKVTIQDQPKDEKKQDDPSKQAEEEQKQHENEQDKKNARDNQSRSAEKSGENKENDDKTKKDFEDKLNKVKEQLDKEKDKQKNDSKGKGNSEKNAGDESAQSKDEQKQGGNADQKQGGKSDQKQDGKPGDNNEAGKQDDKKAAAKGQEQATKAQGEPKSEQANDKEQGSAKSSDAKGNDGKADSGKAQSKEKSKANVKEQSAKDKDQGSSGTEQLPMPKSDGARDSKAPDAKDKNDSEKNNTAEAKKKNQGAEKKDGNQAGSNQEIEDGQKKKDRKLDAKPQSDSKDTAKDKQPDAGKGGNKSQIAKADTEPAKGEIDAASKQKGDEIKKEATGQSNQGAGANSKDANEESTAKGDMNKDEKKSDNAGSGSSKAKPADKSDEKEPGGESPGKSGPGGQGTRDEVTKAGPDYRRGGDLQIEDLKSRMTPETLKKLGWSEQDWQAFLKEAQAYQRILRQEGKKSEGMRKGATNSVPNRALRQVDQSSNAALDPLQVDRLQPPPEFREAQRQFTSGTSPPAKK